MKYISRLILAILRIRPIGLDDSGHGRLGVWSVLSLVAIAIVVIMSVNLLEKDFDKSFIMRASTYASLLGFIIGIPILIWSVIATEVSQASLRLAQRMINSIQHSHSTFAEHVKFVSEFLNCEKQGAPTEVTIITSTLAYGILDPKHGSSNVFNPSTAYYFLKTIESWVVHWEQMSPGNQSPVLHLSVWPKSEHSKVFTLPAVNGDETVTRAYNKCLNYLKTILERIRKLVERRVITVNFTTTTCENMRLFLVRFGDGTYKSAMVMMTKITPATAIQGTVKHITWTSETPSTYSEYMSVASEAENRNHNVSSHEHPHVDGDAFTKAWFDIK